MTDEPASTGHALPPRIAKDVAALRPAPNLRDPAATAAAFRWDDARALLDGLPAGGLNIAHEAVDRHLQHGRGAKPALRWIGKSGARRDFSYADLAAASNRFANALATLGVQPGERVFLLMGRLPELYVALLGALKARCSVTPLFSAFGPEPIATRCAMGDARVLVTTPELYQRKLAALRDRLPGLRHVVLVGDGTAEGPGLRRWGELVDTASPHYAIAATDPETPSLLHFTSGTTGRPKGAVHVHQAVLAHAASGRFDGRSRGGPGVLAGEFTSTYWYAPSIRAIVKSTTTSTYRGTAHVELVEARLQP